MRFPNRSAPTVRSPTGSATRRNQNGGLDLDGIGRHWHPHVVAGLDCLWYRRYRRGFQPPFARYRLTIAPTARIYEIDGPNAWRRLCTRYPTAGEDARLVPDWSAVADEWDGVHLTLGGLLTAEQVHVEGPEEGWTEHWGWDAEQTVWLRDVFTDAMRLPDLAELAEPPDRIEQPGALWIKPGPDTYPWLVSIPMDSMDVERNEDDPGSPTFPPWLRR